MCRGVEGTLTPRPERVRRIASTRLPGRGRLVASPPRLCCAARGGQGPSSWHDGRQPGTAAGGPSSRLPRWQAELNWLAFSPTWYCLLARIENSSAFALDYCTVSWEQSFILNMTYKLSSHFTTLSARNLKFGGEIWELNKALLSIIVVGLRTDLLKGACHTLQHVLFVIRMKKSYNTSLWAVSSLSRYGSQFSKPYSCRILLPQHQIPSFLIGGGKVFVLSQKNYKKGSTL